MAYIAPIHRASSIRHGIKCNFVHQDRESLVIAKSNRVEVYDLVPRGLEQVTHFTVYGRITALLAIKPQISPLDHLFIATDRYDYFTISWNPVTLKIQNERRAQDVTDRFQRAAHSGHLYLSDPEGRLLGLYLYEGIFTAIPIKRQIKTRGRQTHLPDDEIGNLDEPCPIRMNELRVVNMAFLSGASLPVVAVLYQDSKNSLNLTSYEVSLSKRAVKEPELKEWSIKAANLDSGSRIMIPVSSPLDGVIVVGEQSISYLHQDRVSPLKKQLYEIVHFVSFGRIDTQRFLLSDESGSLYLLLLVTDTKGVANMRIENLGGNCQARAIVYLDNGFVFLGSHFGDSQLIQLSSTAPKINIIQSLSNLAPISDFIVLGSQAGGREVHQYSSGQTMILTCSGGFHDGGLKSVRSGVGIEDLGILGEMRGVQYIWALRTRAEDMYENDDILIFSCVHETRIFSFSTEEDVEELERFGGFSLDVTTLASGNVEPAHLFQVTPTRILLVDRITQSPVDEWLPTPGSKINIASMNGKALVAIVDGRTCMLFDIFHQKIIPLASQTFESEVSCATAPTGTDYIAVGFWSPSSVTFLRMPDLTPISTERLNTNDGVVPRSIVVAEILSNGLSTMLVGMGDGEVISYTISSDAATLSDKGSIRLGTQAVNLELMPRSSRGILPSVFACCDRPTLIYEEEGRIVYSAVTVEGINCVASFNATGYLDSVVFASDEEVSIAKIDDVRTTHTRTSHINQFARRIAFSKQRKVYAVATIKSFIEQSTGMESSACFLHIIDENFYDKIDAYELQSNELVNTLICAQVENAEGISSDRFIVGTAIASDEDGGETGRLLIFELGEDKVLRLSLSLTLASACHSLDLISGYLVAGLNKSIDLYRVDYLPSSACIKLLSSLRASTIPVTLAVHGSRVFVGDLVKGVMVLELVSGVEGQPDKLVEICRQYGVSWVTALEALENDMCISADSEGNLMVLGRDAGGVTEEDRKRMRPLSELRLGEMVNCIRKVYDPVPQGSIVQPKAYVGTVEGGLYMMGLIHPNYLDVLMKLQVNMSRIVKGIGDLDFNRYRAFNTKGRQPEEPFRFVDGELIERFLDLDPAAMSLVVDGNQNGDSVGCSVVETKNIVETLRRMR